MNHNHYSDPQALQPRLKDGTLMESRKTDIPSLAQRVGLPNLREIRSTRQMQLIKFLQN